MNTALFGKLAGILSIIAYFPYIWAIIKHKATPNRASWIIWTIVSGIIFFSYHSAGATDTIWVPAGYTLGSFIVSLLSIKYGEGGWTKLDRNCFFAAGIGLIFWWIFNSPLFALYISLAIDTTASLPTIKKAYLNPLSENKLAWFLFWLGSVANVLAINSWIFVIYLYPVTMFLTITPITLMVMWDRGRPKQKKINYSG